MGDFKPIRVADALLRADDRLNEGWIELNIMGLESSNKFNVYRVLDEFMGISERPKISEVIRTICESGKSRTWKVFALEAVACDLSLVAKTLGLDLND